MKPEIHVEVVQKLDSNLSQITLCGYVENGLCREERIFPGVTFSYMCDKLLNDHVESIHICEQTRNGAVKVIDVSDHTLKIHVYKLVSDGAQTENIETGDGDNGELAAASHWILPSREFHGLWENLIYDADIKHNLLHFMETTLLFSKQSVSPQIITWNKVILLHGPPGTGKTSLCKALAQKLTIRLSQHYTHGQLLEVNSHSLFSKWFSESGKLVQKMFSKIHELIENPHALVIVLIDEVESLAHARKSSVNGTEPSDSIRTVNALLTQIDNLRRYPNVLILTTSNVTEAIDLAFVDRADIKQYIGPPSTSAIYKIFGGCIEELMRVGIINPQEAIPSYHCDMKDTDLSPNGVALLQICKCCEGLSGRTLRKLPFLAHALYVQRPTTTFYEFLSALKLAVKKHKDDEARLVPQ